MAVTQSEYEFLMRQDKIFEDNLNSIKLAPAPLHWTKQINSLHSKETFNLDFYRGSFELTKYTINKRFRQIIILLRYDNGGRHTNPDGVLFEGPHVHLYREGYNDKFAFPVEEINVMVNDPLEDVFKKIMHFCNVKNLPPIEVPMF